MLTKIWISSTTSIRLHLWEKNNNANIYYGIYGHQITDCRFVKLGEERQFVKKIIRLAHCKCKSLMQRPSRLSSVCLSVPRQISKTKRDRREISQPLLATLSKNT